MSSFTEIANKILEKILTGGRRTLATGVREVMDMQNASYQNKNEKNIADGYAGLNGDGKVNSNLLSAVIQEGKFLKDTGDFEYVDETRTAAGAIVMSDFSNAKNFVFNGTTAAWTSMTSIGNKAFTVTNMGTGNLTINYPAAAVKIIDLAVSLTPVNTIVLPTQSKYTIIDDGNFLIFTS